MKIQNTTDKGLAIPNFKAFKAKEIRTVTESEAKILLLSPFLVKVKPLERPKNTEETKVKIKVAK